MVEHLKDVPHAFVKVELYGDAGVIECLVVPDCIAQKDFLRSSLDQCGWKTLRVISVDGRHIGMLLVGWCRIGIGTVFQVAWIVQQRIRILERRVGISCFSDCTLLSDVLR